MPEAHAPIRRTALRLLAVLALCTAGAASARPAEVELHAHPAGTIALEGRFEVLHDPRGRLSLDEVRQSDDFLTATRRRANVGYTDGAVWARLRLVHPDAPRERLVLSLGQTLLDRAELFVVRDGEVVDRQVTGDTLPFAERGVPDRHLNFILPWVSGESVDYYLRVIGPTSAISLPLTLHSHSAFARSGGEDVLLGGYFGVMAALALTALLLFVLVRDTSFLFFGLYLAAYGLVMACWSGYGYQFLWPEAPVLQQRLPVAFIALALLSGTLISRRFLDTPRRIPRSDRIYGAAAMLAVAGTFVHLTVPGHLGSQLVIGAVLALLPAVMFFGVRCAQLGDRIARYWLAGWMLYITGVSAVALYIFGWLPYNLLTAYGMYLGSLADFISLSIALSARVWVLRQEKAVEVESVAAELANLNENLEEIVGSRTEELERRNRELSELAIRDSLTGLYNHSTSIELLDQLLQQSQRYEFPLSTIMVDIDHFKAINDSFGHQTGDRVLESVARTLTDCVRGADIVGRYGGEEFLIAMPHADALAAREFGERLLRRIRDIEIPASQGGSISASIGATVYYPHGLRDSAQEVIQRADEALYRSKADGRDRLTIESLSLVPGAGRRPLGGDEAPRSTERPVKPV